jgi:hypothetical protein
MKLKHTLASRIDKKATITNTEIQKLIQLTDDVDTVKLHYKLDDDNAIGCITYKKTRGGKSWYAQDLFPYQLKMPAVGEPSYLKVLKIQPINNTQKTLDYELG